VVEKRGAWYYFEGDKIGQGKDNTKDFLLNNIDLFDKIKTKALDNKSIPLVN
jgi:recombination protein RecA